MKTLTDIEKLEVIELLMHLEEKHEDFVKLQYSKFTAFDYEHIKDAIHIIAGFRPKSSNCVPCMSDNIKIAFFHYGKIKHELNAKAVKNYISTTIKHIDLGGNENGESSKENSGQNKQGNKASVESSTQNRTDTSNGGGKSKQPIRKQRGFGN